MKIFFNASLTGKKLYQSNYLAIIDQLEKLGHTIISAPVKTGEIIKVAQASQEQAEKYYEDLMKSIAAADINIFEVSYPSTGIGHEIAVSLHKGKPVIALYVKDKNPYIFDSVIDEKLQVIEYNIRDLGKILVDVINYALDQQDVRFNFFISPEIQQYLDWVAKYKRIPRAVYLRELLERDMRENKDWSKQK